MSKTIRFQIRLRGHQEQPQKDKLLQYEGPDNLTKALLLGNHESWRASPVTFWTDATDTAIHALDSQGQAMWLFVQASGDDA